MRKLLAIGLFVLLALGCYAQVIIYTNTPTFEWDVVTTYLDLTPLDPSDVVEYEVFVAEPATHTGQTSVGVTSGLFLLVTVPINGPWAYGVRTNLITDGGATTLYSTIAWSDVEGIPTPFLYDVPTTTPPNPPTGLRTQ